MANRRTKKEPVFSWLFFVRRLFDYTTPVSTKYDLEWVELAVLQQILLAIHLLVKLQTHPDKNGLGSVGHDVYFERGGSLQQIIESYKT